MSVPVSVPSVFQCARLLFQTVVLPEPSPAGGGSDEALNPALGFEDHSHLRAQPGGLVFDVGVEGVLE